ncbi:MAG: DUF4188 domain-containing protein [Chloroflexia bacterium]|nr:DUF4188 domain-containing protein [Chloroflexia bacterium]
MAGISAQPMTAEVDGEFVVFLIGMRVNQWWNVPAWLPAFLAMPRMLRELEAQPELGFLGSMGMLPVMVQYWRSFEHLEAYARSREHAHLPAWQAFHQRVRKSGGAVGIWHETYRVTPGNYETLYAGVPPLGLGRAGRLMPVVRGKQSARARMVQQEHTVVETDGGSLL